MPPLFMTAMRRDRIPSCERGPVPLNVDDVLLEHGPRLWRLTAWYANTAEDREDLFQEISVAVWRALATYRGESSVRTFVFRIARNRCTSYSLRQRRRRSREVPLDLEFMAPVSGVGSDVFAILERAQRAARLRAAVACLPLDLQRIVMLRLEGLSDREIGARLGITEGHTAVRLFRARRRLRRILDPAHFSS